jgi:hypothetical protein
VAEETAGAGPAPQGTQAEGTDSGPADLALGGTSDAVVPLDPACVPLTARLRVWVR